MQNNEFTHTVWTGKVEKQNYAPKESESSGDPNYTTPQCDTKQTNEEWHMAMMTKHTKLTQDVSAAKVISPMQHKYIFPAAEVTMLENFEGETFASITLSYPVKELKSLYKSKKGFRLRAAYIRQAFQHPQEMWNQSKTLNVPLPTKEQFSTASSNPVLT